MPCSSAAAITSGVADRAAGLDDRASRRPRRPDRRRRGRGRTRRSRARSPAVDMPDRRRLVHGEERRVDARHLARADADRRAVAREHDRVGLHARHRAPREQQIATLLVGGLALRHDAPRAVVDRRRADAPARADRRARACSRARCARHRARPSSTRRFFLRPRISSAPSLNDGATTHSTNRLDTASAVASSTGTVNEITEPNADTGSHASAFLYASSASVPVASPHGVVCLTIAQHGCSPNGSVASSAPSRSSRLLNESSLPPLLREPGEPAAGALDVERRRLTRVLAVAQPLRSLERDDDPLGELLLPLGGEPRGDGRVVRRRMLEHLHRESATQVESSSPAEIAASTSP